MAECTERVSSSEPFLQGPVFIMEVLHRRNASTAPPSLFAFAAHRLGFLRGHRLAFFALLGLFMGSACYCGLDEIRMSNVSCETDEQCFEETDGEYEHCGSEGRLICCTRGSMKCGCHEDLTCNSQLECFDVDHSGYPRPGPYCLPGWVGPMPGIDSLE